MSTSTADTATGTSQTDGSVTHTLTASSAVSASPAVSVSSHPLTFHGGPRQSDGYHPVYDDVEGNLSRGTYRYFV